MQEKNEQLPPKKGKGKLPLFCGNGEQVIPIYAYKRHMNGEEDSHLLSHRRRVICMEYGADVVAAFLDTHIETQHGRLGCAADATVP